MKDKEYTIEADYAMLEMMGATDEELAQTMTPEQIAAFRAWQAGKGESNG